MTLALAYEFKETEQYEAMIKQYEGIIWSAISVLKRGFRVRTGRSFVNGITGIEYVDIASKNSVEEIEFVGGFEPDEFEREDMYSAACMAIWQVMQNPSVEYWAGRLQTVRDAIQQDYHYEEVMHKIYVKRIYSAVRKEAYKMKKENQNVTKSYEEAIAGESYLQKELSDGFLSALLILERNGDHEAIVVARLLSQLETTREIQNQLKLSRLALGRAIKRIEEAIGIEA